jgi:hypothetical protein
LAEGLGPDLLQTLNDFSRQSWDPSERKLGSDAPTIVASSTFGTGRLLFEITRVLDRSLERGQIMSRRLSIEIEDNLPIAHECSESRFWLSKKLRHCQPLTAWRMEMRLFKYSGVVVVTKSPSLE